MGGLSMNPDNHGMENGPRLAAQIAREEEEMGINKSTKPESSVAGSGGDGKIKKNDKMKLGPFEFDTTYPRTIPGFIRIFQVLTLLVSFVCLLLTSWPSAETGSYTFYCIFLVFGMLISGYLLFTVMAGNRGKDFCGISWIMVELVYFSVFGLLIFIGACLAANRSGGKAALNAAAVFGFFSFATFVYYFYITWKLRGEKPEDEEEKEDEEKSPEDAEGGIVPGYTASQGGVDDYRLEMLEELEPEQHMKQPGMDFRRQNSVPTDLNDELYENGKLVNDRFHSQRRRHSNSEKDSAYSEGPSTPRGKTLPNKMQRTGSGYRFGDHQPRGDYDHVMDRQPLSHMTHRTRHGGSFRGRSMPQNRSMGYPQEIQANSFNNLGFEADDLHRHSSRRKSMPEWLRAALGEDVRQDNMIDDESEPDHHVDRRRTLPPQKSNEFPLLNTSDEESVNYPSVSQNGMAPGVRGFSQTLPHHQQRRRSGGHRGKHHHPHHSNHQHHHHQGGHGRRRFGSRRHHHRHHHHGRRSQHRRGGHHHQAAGGRRPVNDAHEDYLRRMVENDELVMQRKDQGMQGFQPMEARPIETGKRRVIPEQPISIHFPEQSRWDDDAGGGENPLMAKYFADAQEMRA